MTRTKLCGLTRETDIDAAITAGTDMVGFVCNVQVETPRELTPARAAELADRVPPSVTSVLVTMPETPTTGADLVENVDPDAVQVHGCSPDEVAKLTECTEKQVFVGVDAAGDDLGQYAAAADALVLDSTDEHGAGGTGETHDWQQAGSVVADLDIPVLLAGGLTPENVAAAVRRVEPFGVDVSSGIEREQSERDARRRAEQNEGVEAMDGVKDHAKLQRFVKRATGVRTVSA